MRLSPVLLRSAGETRCYVPWGSHWTAAGFGGGCAQPAAPRIQRRVCRALHSPSRPHAHHLPSALPAPQVALDRVAHTVLFGQEARVNWAFQVEQKEEVATHFHVFVGDLSPGECWEVVCVWGGGGGGRGKCGVGRG